MLVGFDVTALHVAQGGVFTYDYSLLRALLELDGQDDYVLLDYLPLRGRRPAPPELAELAARGGRIVRCRGVRHRRLARWKAAQAPLLQAPARCIDRALSGPWSAAARWTMRRALSRALAGVDVFHSSDVLLWRQPDARNVVTIYDLTALLMPQFHTAETVALQQRKFRFAREKADVVVAISEITRRDVVTHLGILPDRVRVVYGGVDPAFCPIADREVLVQSLAPLGLVPGGYILYVGNVEPRKNLVCLVEAYDRARQTLPPPLPRLVLAGAATWKSAAVFARVEELGLQDSVLFAGRVPGRMLPALYNGALLFVYPSLYEGFGLPPLEAMACGVPVIAANRGALPEVVGEAGLLFDAADGEALTAAIVETLGDARRRQALGRAGLERARSFTWQRAAAAMRAVYEGA